MKPSEIYLRSLAPSANIPVSRRPERAAYRAGAHTHTENPLIQALKALCDKREYVNAPYFTVFIEGSKDALEAKKSYTLKPLTLNVLASESKAKSGLDYLRGKGGGAEIRTATKHVCAMLKAMHIQEGSAEWNSVLAPEILEAWKAHIQKEQQEKAQQGKKR